jgi:hypothetical protein
MSFVDVTSFDVTLKDFYPRPGERIKQYVVETRREYQWEDETCPRVDVPEHDDNTGASCRNVGRAQWRHLDHDCCSTCEALDVETASRTDVQEWLAAKAARPPICSDRTRISDEIAPEWPSLREHPMFAMPPKGSR